MTHEVITKNLGSVSLTCTLRRSRRARSLSITIHSDGRSTVTAPYFVGIQRIENFIEQKKSWITQKLKYVADKTFLKAGTYENDKEKARLFIGERIQILNTIYGFSWKTIRIKRHKGRWGSCSSKGNLNFNYKIIYLPPHLADYIIVHELCHLKELNHGLEFWKLVGKACPLWKSYRNELKKVVC